MATIRVEAATLTGLNDQALASLIDMGEDASRSNNKRLIVRNVGTGSDTAWALVVDVNDPLWRYLAGLAAPDEQPTKDDRVLLTDDALVTLWALGFPIFMFDPVLGVKEWETPDAETMKAKAPGAWQLVVKADARARSLGYR